MAVQYRNSKIHPKSAMYSSIVKTPHSRAGAVFKTRLACFLAISELKSEGISCLVLVIPFSLLSRSHRLCFETRTVTVQFKCVHVYIYVQTFAYT